MESKIILFSYDPEMEKVCAASMRSCYSAHSSYDLFSLSSEKAMAPDEKPFDDQRIRSLLRKALELEHMDIFEHGQLTFDIEHVSRACTHQLVRHRLASFSQQSQRYVKITRSRGYIKPPRIGDGLIVPVQIRGAKFEITFDEAMDISRQVEEGLLGMGVRSEDARYVRPNAAVTNIVTSMNPRQLLHVLALRCAPDAQWEIRDLAWGLFACAKLVAPNIFETLPGAASNSQVRDKIAELDVAVKEARGSLAGTSKGELVEISLTTIGLEHPVRAFVRKLQ